MIRAMRKLRDCPAIRSPQEGRLSLPTSRRSGNEPVSPKIPAQTRLREGLHFKPSVSAGAEGSEESLIRGAHEPENDRFSVVSGLRWRAGQGSTPMVQNFRQRCESSPLSLRSAEQGSVQESRRLLRSRIPFEGLRIGM